MTYIAAFPCQSGIVMCADTQETVGECKNYVEKIAIIEGKKFPLAVGGAGAGILIDALMQEITERAAESKPSTKLELRKLVADSLREVYQNDLPTLVLPKQHCAVELLVAAKPTEDDFCIFHTRGRRVRAEVPMGIIGYATSYNNDLLRRMHRESLPMPQAVMLAVYLLSQSKKFDDGVGGETSVAIVKENGAYLDGKDWISTLEGRAREFMPVADDFFLACTDVGLSKRQFEEKLSLFVATAQEFRTKSIHQAAERMGEMLLSGNIMRVNDPYPKFPLGGSVTLKQDVDGYLYCEGNDDPAEIPPHIKAVLEEAKAKQTKSSVAKLSDSGASADRP